MQELAAGAVAWAKARGGAVSAGGMVTKMAQIGAQGRHAQNAERDLQVAVRRFGRTLRVKLEECRVRMWDPRDNKVLYTDLTATQHDLSIVSHMCLYGILSKLNPNPFMKGYGQACLHPNLSGSYNPNPKPQANNV